MSEFLDAQGAPLALGRKIGEGGEGAVYTIDARPGLVAKIYAEPPDAHHVAKLSTMAAVSDPLLRRVAAWPSGLVYDGSRPVGFTMPKLASLHPLHELFGPRRRQQLFPDAHWTFLVHTGINLARAFDVMHGRGIVVGDVNSNNVVVHRNSKTRFIDCDSFQIRHDGALYRCNVGVPEYQPPELQAADLSLVDREPQHDCFGLAVMLFQLLFVGKHPFAGILPPQLAGNGAIGTNVAAKRFFYARDAARDGLRPPPGSLALTALPEAIEALFMRAFVGDPADRPAAAVWRAALRELETATVTCERNPLHRHVRGSGCPWCALDSRGLRYFVAPRTGAEPVHVDDSAWERVTDADVERWWTAIEAIAVPPALAPPAAPPARATTGPWWSRVAGLVAVGTPARTLARERRLRAERAREAYAAAFARWEREASLGIVVAERRRLADVRARLAGQRARREAELQALRAAQLARDAYAYLAEQPLPIVPQVPGALLTPSGPTTGIDHRVHRQLAAAGIFTMADVSLYSLRAVPHLRSWRIDVLLAWRAQLDEEFRARPTPPPAPGPQREITERYARERAENAALLADGADRLRAIVDGILRAREELTPLLPVLDAQRRAAQADARFTSLLYRGS